MVSKSVVIENETGMHTRPANEFVKEVKKYESVVTLEANGKTAKAKSLLKILSLGIKCGTEVIVNAEGADETAAAEELAAFLKDLRD
jgi:phosphocarrier protein HPr